MTRAKRQSFGLPAVLAAVVLAGAATADAQCAAPACPAANCFVDPAQVTDDTTCACGSILTACDTIQRAIDIASPGDVIEVAAGTYPEAANGPLTINKTLTLWRMQETGTHLRAIAKEPPVAPGGSRNLTKGRG